PGLWKIFRTRHPPREQKLRPNAPMTEIRERDDRVPSDTQQILKNRLGPQRGLNGEAQNGIVERVVRIIVEVAIRVALNDGKATGHAGVHALSLDLDAAAIHAFRLGEQLQQS